MKTRIKSAKNPGASSENALVGAADPPANLAPQELERPLDGENTETSTENSEIPDELAEDIKVKLDCKIAEKAFLISRRHEFRNETPDWSARVQAEIAKPDNLRSNFFDRRDLGKTDRRRNATKDRRSH